MKRPRTVRDVVRRGSTASVTSKPSQVGSDVTSAPAASGRINPRWTWHQRVLLALRERLLTERQARLTEAAQPLEPHSMDPADSASDEFDHAVALAMLSAEQDALHEIEAALHRIRTGTYGRCEISGNPISAARLRAIPWTRFARTAEAEQEDTGKVRTPHLGKLRTIRPLRPTGRLSDAVTADASSEVTSRSPNPVSPALVPPTTDFPFDELNPET